MTAPHRIVGRVSDFRNVPIAEQDEVISGVDGAVVRLRGCREMRELTETERGILSQHALWLSSGGAEGECADLHNADLHNADLRGADLRGVNLCRSALCRGHLCDADLFREYRSDIS